MGVHIREQRLLILFAHFTTDLKTILPLSPSFQSQITLCLPSHLKKVPDNLRTEAQGRGISGVLCVTENVFALASAPDEAIA